MTAKYGVLPLSVSRQAAEGTGIPMDSIGTDAAFSCQAMTTPGTGYAKARAETEGNLSAEKQGRSAARQSSIIVEEPSALRARGRLEAKKALRRWERNLEKFPNRKPPMQPSNELDDGLVLARYAGLLEPQAVRPILKDAARFKEWLMKQPRRRGPAPDWLLAIRIFIACRAANAILRRKGLPERKPTPKELGFLLKLLHDENVSAQTAKKRLQRTSKIIASYEKSKLKRLNINTC